MPTTQQVRESEFKDAHREQIKSGVYTKEGDKDGLYIFDDLIHVYTPVWAVTRLSLSPPQHETLHVPRSESSQYTRGKSVLAYKMLTKVCIRLDDLTAILTDKE